MPPCFCFLTSYRVCADVSGLPNHLLNKICQLATPVLKVVYAVGLCCPRVGLVTEPIAQKIDSIGLELLTKDWGVFAPVITAERGGGSEAGAPSNRLHGMGCGGV